MEKEHLEIILEDINSKFNIVIEGHQSLRKDIADTRIDLNEKFDFLNFKIDTVSEHLSKKINAVEEKLTEQINAVATDLKAHRNDTEAHQIYQVKE